MSLRKLFSLFDKKPGLTDTLRFIILSLQVFSGTRYTGQFRGSQCEGGEEGGMKAGII
jgi:hypothetical protein